MAAWPAELAPPDDDDFFPGAQLRLHRRRRIVNALPFVFCVVFQVEPAIPGAGGNHHDASLNGEFADVQSIRVSRTIEMSHRAGNGKPRTELLRLALRAPRQRLPGDAGGKPR